MRATRPDWTRKSLPGAVLCALLCQPAFGAAPPHDAPAQGPPAQGPAAAGSPGVGPGGGSGVGLGIGPGLGAPVGANNRLRSHLGEGDPVTTDTPWWCHRLAADVEARLRLLRLPQPEASGDARRGRRMCDHGEVRQGVQWLRHALVLLSAP